MRDKERRTIKCTQKFGYVDFISYAFSAIREIDGSKQRNFREAQEDIEGQ